MKLTAYENFLTAYENFLTAYETFLTACENFFARGLRLQNKANPLRVSFNSKKITVGCAPWASNRHKKNIQDGHDI